MEHTETQALFVIETLEYNTLSQVEPPTSGGCSNCNCNSNSNGASEELLA